MERVPLGPLTEIALPFKETSTPDGNEMGSLPIRDILDHHT
jgi:hypothetical protein